MDSVLPVFLKMCMSDFRFRFEIRPSTIVYLSQQMLPILHILFYVCSQAYGNIRLFCSRWLQHLSQLTVFKGNGQLHLDSTLFSKFQSVGKFTFYCKLLLQSTKFGAKILHFGLIQGQNEILKLKYSVFCWKFAGVDCKIATFCAYFLTQDATGNGLLTCSDSRLDIRVVYFQVSVKKGAKLNCKFETVITSVAAHCTNFYLRHVNIVLQLNRL